MTASRRKRSLLGFTAAALAAMVLLGLGTALAAGQASAAAPASPGSGMDGPPAPPVTRTPTRTFTPSGPTNTRTPTRTFTPSGPTNTPTRTLTPPPNCPTNYTITQVGAGIAVSGTALLSGSRCDDCDVPIALPFPYTLYDQTFTSARLSTNGQLDFGSPADHSYNNICLPNPNANYAILPYWRDLSLDNNNQGLQQCIDIGCGVYTSVSGSAPNRIFNIEYRAISLHTFLPVYFELRLYEGQTKFEVIYTLLDLDSPNATIGVQKGTGIAFAQYQCPGNPGTLISGTKLTFNLTYICAPATPTPTSTPTNTPTSTPTSTPASTPWLVGHVTWQGRPAQPDPANVLPITLTMRLQSGGPTLDYAGLTTDASGFFTVPVGTLANGIYNWRAKGPKFLANAGTLTLTGAPVTQVEMGLLRTGDTNNDNVVDARDFSVLKAAFGKSSGQPGYDDRADFTGDQAVSVGDFTLLRGNFGQGGAPPIDPTGP